MKMWMAAVLAVGQAAGPVAAQQMWTPEWYQRQFEEQRRQSDESHLDMQRQRQAIEQQQQQQMERLLREQQLMSWQ